MRDQQEWPSRDEEPPSENADLYSCANCGATDTEVWHHRLGAVLCDACDFELRGQGGAGQMRGEPDDGPVTADSQACDPWSRAGGADGSPE